MIKPGYSMVVLAPPRGTLTNQGLVAPSRGTKDNQGLMAPLTPIPAPIYPFYSPSASNPQRLEDGDPPYNLILNRTELNRIVIPLSLPPLYSLP